MKAGLLPRRIMAQIIDTLGYFFFLVLVNIVYIVIVAALNLRPGSSVIGIVQLVLLSVAFIALQAYHLSIWQATLGYKLLGLKIVNKGGSAVSREQAMGRGVLKLIYYAFSPFLILLAYHYIIVLSSHGKIDPIDQAMRSEVKRNETTN